MAAAGPNGSEESRRRSGLRGSRILSFAGAIIFAALLVFVATSDGFRIKSVVAAGNSKVTLEEIQQLAHADGLRSLLVDTDGIGRRVHSLPYVRDCEVSVVLPETVKIVIEERKPYLGLHLGGEYVLVDEEGVVLERTDVPNGTTEVNVADVAVPDVGGRLEPVLVSAFQLLTEQLIKKSNMTVTRVDYSSVRGIQVTIGNGQIIDFGVPDDLDKKLAIVHAFLATDRQWTSLDVTSVDRPYYRP